MVVDGGILLPVHQLQEAPGRQVWDPQDGALQPSLPLDATSLRPAIDLQLGGLRSGSK